MKVLIPLSHPAHYHMLKNFVSLIESDGGRVILLSKPRGELVQVLKENSRDFILIKIPKIGKTSKSGIILSGVIVLISEFFFIANTCLMDRPDIMIGTNSSITTVGAIYGIPSIVLTDDDYSINKIFGSIAFHFATRIISLEVTDLGRYNYKKISYKGFQ